MFSNEWELLVYVLKRSPVRVLIFILESKWFYRKVKCHALCVHKSVWTARVNSLKYNTYIVNSSPSLRYYALKKIMREKKEESLREREGERERERKRETEREGERSRCMWHCDTDAIWDVILSSRSERCSYHLINDNIRNINTITSFSLSTKGIASLSYV